MTKNWQGCQSSGQRIETCACKINSTDYIPYLGSRELYHAGKFQVGDKKVKKSSTVGLEPTLPRETAHNSLE